MNTPVLLIGGPVDGRRQIMETPLPMYWHIQELSGGYSEFEFPKIATHEYRLLPLTIKETGIVHALYAHSSVEDWRSALIDGYRDERA